MTSEPVCPGAVQVTRDGQCIILGVDGQTIGGYPKVAQVASVDLDLQGQLRPGDRVEFVPIDLDEARRLLDGVLAEHADNVAALIERGWIALHHERPEDAEKLLQRAVALAPFDRGANLILWRCLQAEGTEKEVAAHEVRAKLGKIEADEMRIVNLKVQVGDFPNDPKRRREIGRPVWLSYWVRAWMVHSSPKFDA